MSKYFDKRGIALMQKTENDRRSSESFFSSKEGDNFFGNAKDVTLRVVGLEHVKGNGEVGAFNVVKFNDGHQMSTSKFFSAKGLRWPVGGNVAKLNYLASALETEVAIEVTPSDVKVTPMRRRDGSYVGPKGADGKNATLTAGKDGAVPAGALEAVTYIFEEQELPAVKMVNWEEEE